jgi:hypothetical protein
MIECVSVVSRFSPESYDLYVAQSAGVSEGGIAPDVSLPCEEAVRISANVQDTKKPGRVRDTRKEAERTSTRLDLMPGAFVWESSTSSPDLKPISTYVLKYCQSLDTSRFGKLHPFRFQLRIRGRYEVITALSYSYRIYEDEEEVSERAWLAVFPAMNPVQGYRRGYSGGVL